jgi:hypothetical protein
VLAVRQAGLNFDAAGLLIDEDVCSAQAAGGRTFADLVTGILLSRRKILLE